MVAARREKAPAAALPVAGSFPTASRTVLELTATVMEASFGVLGEGVILGTMPRYVERFGDRNAQYLARRYVACRPEEGATSALSPVNFLSTVTGTPFTMVEESRDVAVKRLHGCEFAAAFENKAPFAKAMICLLHKAAYQGSVNGLLENPARDGYDVSLRSRILFGDGHCDFVVESRKGRPHEPDAAAPPHAVPDQAETERQALHFYTAILVSFVDYLTSVLGPEEAAVLLEDCAARVGHKARELLLATLPAARPAGPDAILEALLKLGGRTLEAEAAQGTMPVLRVTACPYAQPIVSGTKDREPEAARLVRENACRLCHGMLRAAVEEQAPGADVERASCLTLGDDDCRFRVVLGGGR